ncbi:MAG: hypothetical protein LBC70_10270 [Chitinispirillales bacterium]|jgi:hypothetical protein|nr:hypothetical protein [Chitinispirillales bacterium]
MFRIFIVLIVAVSVFFSVYGGEKQHLSNNVIGYLSAGEYRVKSTITVPAGETLVILAGVTLYFEQLTGIEVLGTLSVDGEPGAPVVLTSVNAAAGSPEPAQPFDWNGIRAADPSASVRLRHTRVSNSVYGVNLAYPEARAEFEEVVFQDNGYASLAKGEQIVPLAAGEPFNARWNVEGAGLGLEGEQGLARVPVAAGEMVKKDDRGRVRFIVNVSAIGVGAAGVIISSVSLARLDGNFNRYVSENGLERRQANRVYSNIETGTVGLMMTGAALACLGVTLFF